MPFSPVLSSDNFILVFKNPCLCIQEQIFLFSEISAKIQKTPHTKKV
jgi:hypothetical protein